jgi:hypothetical protein
MDTPKYREKDLTFPNQNSAGSLDRVFLTPNSKTPTCLNNIELELRPISNERFLEKKSD